MLSLKDLKKQEQENFEKYKKQVSEDGKKYRNDDDRFWRPTQDNEGNGRAIIRFLPNPAVDGLEGEVFITKYSYSFKNNGKWFIEDSPTTINKPCPVFELNGKLYNSGDEYQKKQAQNQNRTTSFITNIYIVNDVGNPSNNGKVMLFSYGKSIRDKIATVMKGDPELNVEGNNPISFENGNDFVLRIKKKKAKFGNSFFNNYEESTFLSPSPIRNHEGTPLTEDEIERIFQSEYSLQELKNPENFKSYEELKKRLDFVLGNSEQDSQAAEMQMDEMNRILQENEREIEEQSRKSIEDIDDEIPYEKFEENSNNVSSELDDFDKALEEAKTTPTNEEVNKETSSTKEDDDFAKLLAEFD